MSDSLHSPDTADICLLLRAHGEQLWIRSRVLPLLTMLERPASLPEEQLGAALAYLELLWLEAGSRAAASDAALARLQPPGPGGPGGLREQAGRYHAAVRSLRTSLAGRVERLLAAPKAAARVEHAST